MSLFVAGTDTGVGKTVVSALLAVQLGRKYWKPVQCGTEPMTDSQFVAGILGADRIYPEAYRLREPLAPPVAARAEGLVVSMSKILAERPHESSIIEGAGGVLTPLNEKTLYVHLIAQLGYPVVVVARSGLGTINHTLLTLSALRTHGLHVAAVIMVGAKNLENKAAIEHYGSVKVGTLPLLAELTRAALNNVNLELEWENEVCPQSLSY